MKINQMPQAQQTMMASATSDKKNRATGPTSEQTSGQAMPAEASDVTQTAIQSAQQELNMHPTEVDQDKVAQVQALLAAGGGQVDRQALASSMLDYHRRY